jgi:adenylate cyclase
MSTRSMVRLGISMLVFLVFALHSGRWLPLRLLDVVEAFTYDARVVLTLPQSGDPRVVVVDLDERTLAAEGWPLRRDKMAILVEQLFETYGIRALGFDIVFSEPDDRAMKAWEELSSAQLNDVPGVAERDAAIRAQLDYDRQFAEAIRGRPVVMGFFFKQAVAVDEAAVTGSICAPLLDAGATRLYAVDFLAPAGAGGNVPALQAATPYCGFFDNPIVDDDGAYRRVPLLQQFEGALYPSLALALARVALDHPAIALEFDPPDRRVSMNLERVRLGSVATPVDQQVAVYVPYRGDNRTFTYVSVTDVIRGQVAQPEVLKNAVVLMGATAAGLLDFRSTPVNRVFAGVEVHANIVSGILDGSIRQRAPYYSGIEVSLLLLIALLLAWAFSRLTAALSAVVVLAVVAAVMGLAFGLWSGALFIMPLGVPLTFTLVLFMAHLLYGYFIESRSKRDALKAFGQYVPPELVDELAAKPQAISMAGKNKEMTVLFSDVRSFTTISEQFKDRPQELSELMNMFLTALTGAIQKHRGTIDKYMGDAIMAFWGAPLDDPDHAVNAMLAGMEMAQALRALDAPFAKRGWPQLQIGVGVNSGMMSVGNMGSQFRAAYTVMGDAVNLGSRLEGLTKEYGAAIICSESTRNAAPSDWAFRELDRVRVKGKREPVTIYEPMGPKEALPSELRQELARHRGAMQLYRAQKWDAAELEFFNLSRAGKAHPVYALFIERIMFLRANPPGKDWDGAFTFDHK